MTWDWWFFVVALEREGKEKNGSVWCYLDWFCLVLPDLSCLVLLDLSCLVLPNLSCLVLPWFVLFGFTRFVLFDFTLICPVWFYLDWLCCVLPWLVLLCFTLIGCFGFTLVAKGNNVFSVKLLAKKVMVQRFIQGENLSIHHIFCFSEKKGTFKNIFPPYFSDRTHVGHKRFFSNGKFGKVWAFSIIHTAHVDGLQELGCQYFYCTLQSAVLWKSPEF